MNALVDQFFTFREERSSFNQKKQRLISLVQKEVDYQVKKISTWEENLTEAAKAEKFKLYGELLLANAYCLEKGLTEVSLADFHDPSSRVLISLDPQFSPVENAKAFFKKYQKAKKARLAVQSLLEKARQEWFYLLSVETALQQTGTLDDLAEISQELMNTGYLAKATTGQKSKDKPEPKQKTSLPLKFISSDNLTILVGKNNRQNDYLTMRLAQENDVWLHTKEIPGSHVIIKTNGQPVPPATLQEAAILAAFYSRARQSHNVPVDYTDRKHVKKPPGTRPGFVTYTNHHTIIVNPDKNLPPKL
jgi:predicted ribosome quality control (RQC) complex YloA/Tae2 family protein